MTHFAHNPFKTAQEHVDYREYKDDVENFIERYVRPLKDVFNWIDIEEFKRFFWKIVDSVDEIHPNTWKVNLSYLLGRILALKVLLHRGRIIPQVYNLNVKWFDYLVERFLPYIHSISSDFLGQIYDGIPVMELPQAKSLLDRMVRVYGTNNLIDVLGSSEVDIIEKIRAFDENYRLHYGYFLTRCKHIGDELNRLENPRNLKDWGKDLRKIFFLEKKHQKTPPTLVEETLCELIHVRNAASHIEIGGIHNIDDSTIQILDQNSQGNSTFDRIIEVEDLWKFYYDLINLDRSLDMFALFLQTCLQLRYEQENNVVRFICECGNNSITYISPEAKKIACARCLKVYKVSSLKKYRVF